MFFLAICSSCRLLWYLPTLYLAHCLDGNSVSQRNPKSRARRIASPSTREVMRVTGADFLLPAGKANPILSSFSRRFFPPSLDLARRRTPPNKEALRHSGAPNLLWISATVTLYLEVLLSRESRPSTRQKTSAGPVELDNGMSLLDSLCGMTAC